jgi:uncharacterized damage-inducible protein DinB
MTIADIKFLYNYTESANEQIFDAAAALTPEQTMRQVGGSFPSIRETLSHMAAADWIWLCRWTGESPKGWPTWANGSVSEIHEEWRRIHAGRNEFIRSLTDADLEREISFTRINGESDRAKLGFLLQHVANHATYHRGQVASQLRMVGAVPPSTDLLRYRPFTPE